MSRLSLDQQTRVIAALTEGCSVRATERLTGVNRETVLTLSNRVGQGCKRLLDGLMRDLQCGVIELDEQWAFIGCKRKNAPENDLERGDSWLFIALDATSKAVISWSVGKRTSERTYALAQDLHARLLNRPQITADGYAPYAGAIPEAFTEGVDFAQLIKTFQAVPGNDAAHRYSPGSIRGAEKQVVCGKPDMKLVSTSYVERFNLSTRMHMRRFTRLTNAFSKKTANHENAVAVHLGFYNLVRFHETLRCTPAMALGVTDHPWTVSELIERALSAPVPEPVYTPPQPELPFTGMSAAKAMRGQLRTERRLTVIPGGKGRWPKK